jgi:hypothetical protein
MGVGAGVLLACWGLSFFWHVDDAVVRRLEAIAKQTAINWRLVPSFWRFAAAADLGLPWYIRICIKSRADTLANLPDRARWIPARGCGHIGNETVAREPALLNDGGLFNVSPCSRSLHTG